MTPPSKAVPQRTSSAKAFNPFYPALLVVGVVFAITACVYGVVIIRQIEPDEAVSVSVEEHGLLRLVDQNGFEILMIELGILAVVTFAAIGTDSYWTARVSAAEPSPGGDPHAASTAVASTAVASTAQGDTSEPADA